MQMLGSSSLLSDDIDRLRCDAVLSCDDRFFGIGLGRMGVAMRGSGCDLGLSDGRFAFRIDC